MTRPDAMARDDFWRMLAERFRGRPRDVSFVVRLNNTLILGSFASLLGFAFVGLHAHWQAVLLLAGAFVAMTFAVVPFNLVLYRRVSLRGDVLDVVPRFGTPETLGKEDLVEVTFGNARCELVFRRRDGSGVDTLYVDAVAGPEHGTHRAIRIV